MAERPVLFSGPMVRAILDGRKTQTRRIVNPQPEIRDKDYCTITYERGGERHGGPPDYLIREILPKFGLRWRVGDTLWVRETVQAVEREDGLDGVRYLADGAWIPIENTKDAADRWVALNHYRGKRGVPVNSIHMPRWCCRIVLAVEALKVERLQEISEEDAIAEGAPRGRLDDDGKFYEGGGDYRTGYAALWDHINGADRSKTWDANPWVLAATFKRIEVRP